MFSLNYPEATNIISMIASLQQEEALVMQFLKMTLPPSANYNLLIFK